MRKEKKDKHFLHKPTYPGGLTAIRKFVAAEIQYPPAALQQKIEGTVYLRYSIDYKGKVIDTKVISSLGHGCDEEAIRVVKKLRFEVSKTRGLKVLFHKNIRIHFHLPPSPPPKPINQIQVNYSLSKKEEKPETLSPPKKGNGGYTITWG